MEQPSDSNKKVMYSTWGSTKLVTDYTISEDKGMLREIAHDEIVPKKHNFDIQNEIHEKIRNEEDYDDWEYGTEPIPLQEWKKM